MFIAWSHASQIGLDLIPLLTGTYRIMHHSPEHRLMPVGFVSSCHILSCQPSTHDGMIVVLHTSTPQPDVIETCSISSLREKKRPVIDFFNQRLVCPVIGSLREAFSSTIKMRKSYHPNIGSSLQLCIDSVTTKVWVHLQTC